MIHLLIVDDEQIIRMGIKNSISWGEHGIEVVGSASDGEDAFQLALKYRPDIVLTDLRMPRMDGIALIKKMKEAGLSAKVIVLTAYNETSYYAEVIPLGIENFVLKNACSDAILDEVLKVAKKIQKERQIHNITESHEKLLTENMFVIQSSYMAGVLSGKELPSGFVAKRRELNLPLPGPSFAVFVMSIREDDQWTVARLAGQMLSSFSPFAFPYKNDVFVMILNFSEKMQCRNHLIEFMQNIRGFCFRNRFVVLAPFQSSDALFGTEKALEAALDSCCWMEKDEDRFLSPAFQPEPFHLAEALKLEKTFLPGNGIESDQQALKTWFDYMHRTQAPFSALQESACRICIILGSVYKRMDRATETLGQIRSESLSSKVLSDLCGLLEQNSISPSEQGQLSVALDFMKKNYKKNLTVADVAKAVYLSPNYLSRIFRRETGSTFKETLNQIRIENAKRLLKDSSLRHYEIAEMIGYSDYKKFSEYFHKYTGFSAKEYRIRCSEQK